MNKFFGWIAVLLMLAVIFIYSLDSLAGSQALQVNAQANLEYARGQAQAVVIQAQAESRLTSAQAAAITSATMLPWGVLGILGLLGLAIVGLCLVVIVRRPVNDTPAYLPHPVIVYLPAPGQTRRETWQALSNLKTPLLVSRRNSNNE